MKYRKKIIAVLIIIAFAFIIFYPAHPKPDLHGIWVIDSIAVNSKTIYPEPVYPDNKKFLHLLHRRAILLQKKYRS